MTTTQTNDKFFTHQQPRKGELKHRRIRTGFKIRTKLLLLVLSLLAIPWMGYKSVREMENFLLEGQQQALELTSEGIASLLSNREALFDPDVGVAEVLGQSFEVLPTKLTNSLSIDANVADWESSFQDIREYTGTGFFECTLDYKPHSLSVRHALGTHESFVYALFQVTDDNVVFRDPELVSLANSDQLRVTVQTFGIELKRYLLVAREEGRMSVYSMKTGWREPETGEALKKLTAVFEPGDGGYSIKARIPKDIMGQRTRIKFEIVDVDDPVAREITGRISTDPDPFVHNLGRVRLMTPALAKLVEPIYLSEANIRIWDKDFRLRAELGSLYPGRLTVQRARISDKAWLNRIESIPLALYDWVLRQPLGGLKDMPVDSSKEDLRILSNVINNGSQVSERRRHGEAKLIVSALPIWAKGEIQGAILMKQSGNRLLSLQYETLRRFMLLFLGVFLFLSIIILVFASRLTYRVGRLQRETEQATTDEGRLLRDNIRSGTRAADELGSLTRSISAMLQNLGQYTRYLEKLPDTLAHEMHNPLNVVNSSLENLQYSNQDLRDNKYFLRAQNGVQRLRSILTSLTEAASLKEALEQESDQFERYDLRQLVTSCVEGYQQVYIDRTIRIDALPGAFYTDGVPDRMAQLLDKLVDNAIRFSTVGDIVVQISLAHELISLSVLNRGPTLPQDIEHRLFDPMVSSAKDAREAHLGLGLYVVRVIAEFHGGTVKAENRPDHSGVVVTVTLARAHSV
ncbi:MAG: ATP-binding protein [Pseudomonadota bacterium]|nr:ATP-binding protein [Pseudomonadota bacterium]